MRIKTAFKDISTGIVCPSLSLYSIICVWVFCCWEKRVLVPAVPHCVSSLLGEVSVTCEILYSTILIKSYIDTEFESKCFLILILSYSKRLQSAWSAKVKCLAIGTMKYRH